MMKSKAISLLENFRVCAQVPLNGGALAAAEAAVAEGAEALELQFFGRAGLSEFAEVYARFSSDIFIGAGGIDSADLAFEAVDLGAQFLVTPLHEVEVFKTGKSLDVPVIAEALTPLEVRKAALLSAEMVRLFPACMITEEYVKELTALTLPVMLGLSGRVSPSSAKALYCAGIACFFVPANEQFSSVLKGVLDA